MTDFTPDSLLHVPNPTYPLDMRIDVPQGHRAERLSREALTPLRTRRRRLLHLVRLYPLHNRSQPGENPLPIQRPERLEQSGADRAPRRGDSRRMDDLAEF